MNSIEDLRRSSNATVTLREAAAILGVDARTVSGAVKSGEIPGVRVGRRVLIPRHRFLAFLDGAEPMNDLPHDSTAITTEPERDPVDELRDRLLRVLLAEEPHRMRA